MSSLSFLDDYLDPPAKRPVTSSDQTSILAMVRQSQMENTKKTLGLYDYMDEAVKERQQ